MIVENNSLTDEEKLKLASSNDNSLLSNEERLECWEAEINHFLNKLNSPKKFIKIYPEACASYNWKQLCIEKAINRWPKYKKKLLKLKGTC